jgi:hypothetical protein
MNLVNNKSEPTLLATEANREDAIKIAKMVVMMNESLKTEGFDYSYITDFIDNKLYIRQL